MWQWRVTKYNPKFRTSSGNYKIADWTSVADIGRIFNGRKLDMAGYLSMEDNYVDVALHFINESNVSSLSVVNLEKGQRIPKEEQKHGLSELLILHKDLQEGQQLSRAEIKNICRLNLRELLWCKLEYDYQFYIHFGYDYYMYIGSTIMCDASIQYASEKGLFVEELPSPYASS